MKKITILTLLISLFTASYGIAQSIYYVRAGGNLVATGTEADPFFSINQALDVAVSGDILLIDGVNGPINENVESNVNVDLTITGVNNAQVNGAAIPLRTRVLNIADGVTLNLSGITFYGVPGGGNGAVLRVGTGSIANIDACNFLDNTTDNANGGAIYVSSGTCNITNSLFKGNSALGSDDPTGRSGRRGGAIFGNALYGSVHLSIINTTLYKNNAESRGGAIFIGGDRREYLPSSTFTMINCTVVSNSIFNVDFRYSSGGIRIDAGLYSTIQNSIIYGNTYEDFDGSAPGDFSCINTNSEIIDNSIIGQLTDGAYSATTTNSIVSVADLVLDYSSIDDAADLDNVVKFADATLPVKFGLASFLAPRMTDQLGNTRTVIDGFIDAGAWASGHTNKTLYVSSKELASSLNVFYTAYNKSINIINPLNIDVSLEVYSLLGTRVLSLGRINKEEPVSVSSLNSGLYLLLAKSTGNGAYTTKKFIVN